MLFHNMKKMISETRNYFTVLQCANQKKETFAELKGGWLENQTNYLRKK